MAFHNIKLYPYESDEDDEQDAALNESIQDLIPFAVVGSEKTIVVDGKPVRGRQNRWGVINGTSGACFQSRTLFLTSRVPEVRQLIPIDFIRSKK